MSLTVFLSGCATSSNREELIRGFEQNEGCERDDGWTIFTVTGDLAYEMYDRFGANVLIDQQNKLIFILKLSGKRT